MPPIKHSRYQHCAGVTDTSGRTFLTEPAPIRFENRLDTIAHTVQEGERLQDIAAKYYADFGDDVFPAAGLWYVVAGFQPTPIIDPTIKLIAGTRLYVPSKRYLAQRIFDVARRKL